MEVRQPDRGSGLAEQELDHLRLPRCAGLRAARQASRDGRTQDRRLPHQRENRSGGAQQPDPRDRPEQGRAGRRRQGLGGGQQADGRRLGRRPLTDTADRPLFPDKVAMVPPSRPFRMVGLRAPRTGDCHAMKRHCPNRATHRRNQRIDGQ
ncbi:hypothetical protein KL86PLE_30533 [uncultured Pleomorphomonas sp.]|uniref:Uncharacterized protein n=1 Tax=uncultured Pleomorphomonas sp. TaxID=442121 RepID=A0A212LET6_9HYPH|nr:hypothetical protein KL86PLE_30533 [uncultured Pleomorphomonas sp.]